MRDSHENTSRRDFLKKLSVFGTAGVATPLILSACGGGSEAGSEESMDMQEESMAMEEAPMEESFSCMDTSGLTEAEVTQREAVNYVDMTADMEKMCSNCQLYTVPEGDMQCGGCTLVKGPIHPEGYCDLWVAVPA